MAERLLHPGVFHNPASPELSFTLPPGCPLLRDILPLGLSQWCYSAYPMPIELQHPPHVTNVIPTQCPKQGTPPSFAWNYCLLGNLCSYCKIRPSLVLGHLSLLSCTGAQAVPPPRRKWLLKALEIQSVTTQLIPWSNSFFSCSHE